MQPATNFHERKKKINKSQNRKAIDERLLRLSAVVAKIQMDDISSDEEVLEGSDNNNDTDCANESDSSNSDSSDRFILKINRFNGLYIFDEYIKPLYFKFCFS